MVSLTRRVSPWLLAWMMVTLTGTWSVPPAGAQTTEAQSEVSTTQDRVAVQPTENDSQIATRIRSILGATDWFTTLRVRVEDGVVFLNGTVASSDHSEWAQNIANQTDGVVAVVNKLQITQTVSWSLEPATEELRRLAGRVMQAGPLIVLSLLVLPLAWVIARFVARFMRWLLRERVRSDFLRSVLARAVAFPVFLIGVYVVLQVAGLTQLAVSLIGGAGVLGIVIGFAFRDIAENFLASLLLSIRRPFRVGDYINVGGEEGTVHSMNTRSTLLISASGNHIQIPNAVVFKSTIENWSTSPHRRGEFVVGIGYDDVVADAQEIMLDVMTSHKAVAQEPAPLALTDNLGASTVDVKAYYWFDGKTVSSIKLKSALLRQMKKRLTEEGVSMPDAAREVIFPQGIPLAQPRQNEPAVSTVQVETLEKVEPPLSHSDLDLELDHDLVERSSQDEEEGIDANLLSSN